MSPPIPSSAPLLGWSFWCTSFSGSSQHCCLPLCAPTLHPESSPVSMAWTGPPVLPCLQLQGSRVASRVLWPGPGPQAAGHVPTVCWFCFRITSENVAERFGISREKQDTFALASQQK